MKILLVAVDAKYIHTNLAVHSLKAYSNKFGKHISIAQYSINHSEDQILRGIYLENPDVVAFSCYIWNISMISSIIKSLKKSSLRLKYGLEDLKYPIILRKAF